DRYLPLPDGGKNPERSAIKQVASGRFGVTAEYLVNSDVMQIKVAQGAKPGEGGQLPGHKVDATIAKVRHSTPGDEFGFSTAPLIAAGCIMMRKCHLNTCPVGVATQDPVLRKRFKGTPEHVINFFFYVAEEVRALLAEMGYTHLDQIIGDTELLEKRALIQHWKARGLDFSKMFFKPDAPHEAVHWTERQKHPIDDVLDRKLTELAKPALDARQPVSNVDRSTGAMLSGEVAKRFRHKGLREDTISVKLTGTAGQSFGAFLARGVSFELVGAANDYVGKGLSGGRIVIR
ncbi:MAG: hypothetical protein E5X21_30465, partial [Mesorhizobium sp.]